ncbi:MAG TPA: hypothetical protein VGH49_04440 [Xanthobacteraceae bacterium]|jgi:hypothetical protein
MHVRSACFLALAVAGCATNPTGLKDGESVLETLRTENKGIVLIHTALHDARCARVLARMAHPDASGRYISGEEVALKRILNRSGAPIEVTLPAGDYGIVGLDCENGNQHRFFSMRAAESGNIFTGEGAVYAQPIAKFSLQAGEFVDVGSLQLPTQGTGTLFGPSGVFNAYVVPNADGVVQTLAAAKPAVYAHLVQRLMIVPGQAQQPNVSVSPAAPSQKTRTPSTPLGSAGKG